MQITAIRANKQILTTLQLHTYECNEKLPECLYAELLGVIRVICGRLSEANGVTGDNISKESILDKLIEDLQRIRNGETKLR